MCLQRLEPLLQSQQVPYELLTHEPIDVGDTVGAQAETHKARISARDMTKIVIVALDGRLAMVVLPATEALDLDQLKAATGARDVRITSEDDHRSAFPDCERGAMPPFGNLYDMPVYVAESLREDQQIIFAAGTYRRLMRLAYRDFARLVQPTIARLSAAET